MPRGLKRPDSQVDMQAERIAELREEAAEYQRLYRRHRQNQQVSLEMQAREEYERCMSEIAYLESEPEAGFQISGALALACLPCLLVCRQVCVRSTAHVGELNERSRKQRETNEKLQKLGRNIIEKKYVHSRN